MKCKICSDDSAKMLLLSPVQNDIVFTYDLFFKNSEKWPKNLIPKMWLLSSQLLEWVIFSKGFPWDFPWNRVWKKYATKFNCDIWVSYISNICCITFMATERQKEKGERTCDVNCMANAAVANCVTGFLHCKKSFLWTDFPPMQGSFSGCSELSYLLSALVKVDEYHM